MKEFKRGCTSASDEPHSGTPVEAATPEIMEKVYDMILNDQWVKARGIFEAIGISHDTLITILHTKTVYEKVVDVMEATFNHRRE